MLDTPPVLAVASGTVCAGNAIDLNTLVTGNAPAGTLTFHTILADATAGTNALINSTVAPAATTTYFVRSTNQRRLFLTSSITVTVADKVTRR